MTQPSTRILVLGAGVAGLLFTLRLAGKVARESVQITLVDASDTFIVRPRLHEFATKQRDFRRTFREILRNTPVQFLQGRVTSLDPREHRVTVQDQQHQQHELEYDYLVYALGSLTDRHSVPGVAEYAYSLSASGPFSAEALRETLPAIAERSGQVVVCGGGATGIETAAQVASVYPQIKVSLVVSNYARALAFYRDLLGARVVHELPGTFCELHFAGSQILLMAPLDSRPDKSGVPNPPSLDRKSIISELSIRVPDCSAAYKVLRSRGAEFLTPLFDWRGETRALFLDPDGHLLEIREVREA